MSEAPIYAPPPRLCRSRTWREGHLHFADESRRLTTFVQAMDCLPPHCLGDSRIRTHSALEIYGRATPRSVGPCPRVSACPYLRVIPVHQWSCTAREPRLALDLAGTTSSSTARATALTRNSPPGSGSGGLLKLHRSQEIAPLGPP